VDWSLEAINIVRDGKFVYLNPTAVQLYGATTAHELLGQPTRDRVHPDDRQMAQIRMHQLTKLQVNAPIAEMKFLRLDDTVIHAQAQATWIDYEGMPAVHVAWRDITERKRSEEVQRESEIRMQVADEVLHLAFHDVLTKLPNRRVLVDRVNQTRITSKRSGCYAALLLLDLDNFKPLNDTHGHAAGDLLLIEVARRLTASVRETDTVVRFGGDEFVVLLGVLSQDASESAAQAALVAGEIAGVLKQPYELTVTSELQDLTQITHVCSASIGVALFLQDDASLDDMLKWADAAMYRAKKAGKNQIQFHEPTV
jgi:diguanylate cyclase (GGDEF)-like protein/PAS domain S-box-containing protein